MKSTFLSLIILISIGAYSQKKVLDHQDFDTWNRIKSKTISSDGNYVMYSLEKGEKDNFLKIKNKNSELIVAYDRSEKGVFTSKSLFAVFTIKAWKDTIKELKRKKIKKDKLPKDTLGIYDLSSKELIKIADVKSFKIPEKWDGYIAYTLDKSMEVKAIDSIEKDTIKEKKKKKVSIKNGYHLVLNNLINKTKDTFKFVTNYSFSKKGERMAFTTTNSDKKMSPGVYVLDLKTNDLMNLFSADKAQYYHLEFSNSGKKLAFIVDRDTSKVQERPNELYLWNEGKKNAAKLLDNKSAPKGYRVSSDGELSFSKDESKMYFGLAKPTIIRDTTLLDEEIVNVEVWTYDEPRLYTVQELQIEKDRKKSYLTAVNLKNNSIVQLATTKYPVAANLADEGNSDNVLINNSLPYQLESQWTGETARDYAIVNSKTGKTTEILKKITGRIQLSPKGNFAYGYNVVDSTWFTYNLASDKYVELTKSKVFYNELNDSPRHPNSYGSAGWIKDDKAILLYDRYDIWKFNPKDGSNVRLTKGRENLTRYRYITLDKDEKYIRSDKEWLLSRFNTTNKHSGFYTYNLNTKEGKSILSGPYKYSNPIKAKNDGHLIFTRESFQEFPDIRYTDTSFKNQKRISNANPQQNEYNWGTAELVEWTSLDGLKLRGMLIKPEDFDPAKKYPMIVNFYEKSSDGLFNHKAPSAGRSTINYSFYTSRGYVIFNPDVYYRNGYPGESALNCVIPGVTSLIEKGFIDKNNIGVQGHSWGGYQIAYLVTKTDIFKAAEAGAPVPNMISAYGGIRWWTGLSRQFQYEHTQSRIGGTPWEFPMRYIENSPIFNIDKVNTPLLIMHNDADGHVPWYQGIEMFVALRRLGKPSWFLNYNNEPHWPLKLQNRKDFNIRLAQFFDFYLKGAPKPVWMKRGVPAIEKGIHQGLELLPIKNE